MATELEFTPEQEAGIRRGLGFRDGDRELTAADILAGLEVRAVVAAAFEAWLGGDGDNPAAG
jgi:hypothetical protein